MLGVRRRTVQCVWSGNRRPAGSPACDSVPRPVSYEPCRSLAQHCPSTQSGQLDPSDLDGFDFDSTVVRRPLDSLSMTIKATVT